MSERREHREAVTDIVDRLRQRIHILGGVTCTGIKYDVIAAADEIERLRTRLADTERIRREAIGAWVLNHPLLGEIRTNVADGFRTLGYISALDDAAAAGESAVTGEADVAVCRTCKGHWQHFKQYFTGDYENVRTAPCPDCIEGQPRRAVTGEPQP